MSRNNMQITEGNVLRTQCASSLERAIFCRPEGATWLCWEVEGHLARRVFRVSGTAREKVAKLRRELRAS